MTWRPTPTVAAFGLVTSGGTSISRSRAACARQASRQPARSSSGENARASSGEVGTLPSATLILHFLQVPCPPQVESIAMPFQLAASNRVTPGGTRTRVPPGWKTRSTRAELAACVAGGADEAGGAAAVGAAVDESTVGLAIACPSVLSSIRT